MALLKLLFTFAPWISFLIIAQDSLLRVKIGLVVALVMTIAMSAWILGEPVTYWQWIGTALVLAGVLLTSRK